MLDHMIVKIAKWIVLIIIFFLAFGSALYFIFSFYAAIVEQHDSLTQSLSGNNPLTGTSGSSPILANNTNCPDYFYELLNQSYSLVIYPGNDDINTNDVNGFCKNTSTYDTVKKIGHFPAIYFFGRSFSATLLTSFFTLFGVFSENGIPVSIHW